ncbi:flavin reductase family protein [Microbacterium sp. SLBN-146]|uniref:flavin reductase family protein n=1 Tax=Microbacterium sp. SLBN-146 TaxID=2768457 RepID=UPI00116C072D|nr:flavin reductase family protein [Microbacterium sp. SLBN-146]TQJ29997.1 flavin reductase (DIM6/NTAB) family NADH-FMN oxidoreductase RutF [Microbacterium sp. SLBN-146]
MSLLSQPVPPSLRESPRLSADPEHMRTAMGRFPSGVAAICAIVDGRPVGMVVSSFSAGVSHSPPMVMFSVQNSSSTWPQLSAAARLGVSVLGSDQSEACLQLASRSRDRFEGLSLAASDQGAVLLDGATMWLECEVVSTTPAGDHQIIVMQVHGMGADPDRAPLVYHERRFHSLHAIGGR